MKHYLSLIKFSHTIFALPFALLGFVLGVYGDQFSFDIKTLLLIIGCMVFARSAAMAFNRYIDRDIDATNERTAVREIPAGKIKARNALLFVIINAILFIMCAYFLNQLCFFLSPVALMIILGYSWTKRFTFLCHFILGLGLALAPVGAYVAVTGSFSVISIIYGLIIMFWVGGFDILYALQDEQFDRTMDLHSVPVRFGRKRSMLISNVAHIICALLLLFVSYLLPMQYVELIYIHWIAAMIFVGLLIYQHTIISIDDLSRINLAFFTTNGIASVVYAGLVIADFII